MNAIDLTFKSDEQLEELKAQEEVTLETFNNLIKKLEGICKDEIGLALPQLLEYHMLSQHRLHVVKNAIEYRMIRRN